MSDRVYLFFAGLYILVAMYLSLDMMIYALVVFMFLEGATGFSLTRLTQKLRNVQLQTDLLTYDVKSRFNFDAFRVLRLSFAVVMAAAYLAVYEYNIEVLWFVPWFLGFALLGAGVSSVCPLFLAMRWIGFR